MKIIFLQFRVMCFRTVSPKTAGEMEPTPVFFPFLSFRLPFRSFLPCACFITPSEGCSLLLTPRLSRRMLLLLRLPAAVTSACLSFPFLSRSAKVDHFENLQSTNWQTVRWKPPPPRVTPNDPHVGWRTEFRSLEIQLVGETPKS